LVLKCKIHGTVEKVNKKCTKAKVNINKVTAVFGLKVDSICRYDGVEGSAGQIIWMPIK